MASDSVAGGRPPPYLRGGHHRNGLCRQHRAMLSAEPQSSSADKPEERDVETSVLGSHSHYFLALPEQAPQSALPLEESRAVRWKVGGVACRDLDDYNQCYLQHSAERVSPACEGYVERAAFQ